MAMSARLRRVWIRLTADRKKFWALCVCAIAGLLLWARLIIVSQPPRMAIATDEGTSALRADRTPGSGSGATTGADNPGRWISERSLDPKAARVPIRVELWAIPVQDPFVISPLYSPKLTESTQDQPKSDPKPVENPVEIEARLTAQLRALADRLKLEAAVGGSMAVIDGRKYRVGDVIQGAQGSPFQFTLEEVRQRSVILECAGRRFDLQMASPGN